MATTTFNNRLYATRRRRNGIAKGLALAATAFGLGWLVLILGILIFEGIGGLSLSVFTENTPPPGSAVRPPQSNTRTPGMTGLSARIRTPTGIFTATHLPPYRPRRKRRLD